MNGMESIRALPGKYAHFLTISFMTILVISVIVTFAMMYGATLVRSESTNYQGILPQTIPSVAAINVISDEFGQSGSGSIVIIQVAPEYANSTEARDVRDPAVVAYMDYLDQILAREKNVISVSSAASLLRSMNNGELPKTTASIMKIMGSGSQANGAGNSGLFSQYMSSDYTTAVIRVNTASMSDQDQASFVSEVSAIIQTSEKPPGVDVRATGDAFVSQVVMEMIGPETGTLTALSFIGILVLVFVIFASVKYGLISMVPIAFGTIWFFGMIGFIGYTFSPELVGILSMVMGVGVDFGIQLVTRFRREIRLHASEEAMKITMSNVMVPMLTTTAAIVAGFKALSFGQLSLLAKMGDMLGLGILMCFVVAMTLLPSLLLLLEKRKEGRAGRKKGQ